MIIGAGGIGQWIAPKIALALQVADPNGEIVLVDGDRYEIRNRRRQIFPFPGFKATIQAKILRFSFPHLAITDIPKYVSPAGEIIEHGEQTIPCDQLFQEGDIVVMCVDNHKTRYFVSQYLQTLENVTLVSAGNERHTGSAQLFRRRNGLSLENPIEVQDSTIAGDTDEAPYESCTARIGEGDIQLIETNAMAAAIAFRLVSAVLRVEDHDIANLVQFDLAEDDPSGYVGISAQSIRIIV